MLTDRQTAIGRAMMPFMAHGHLDGYSQPAYGFTQGTGGGTGAAPAAGMSPSGMMDGARGIAGIDGTPIRVVVLALAAAAGLTALRMAGFKFNVGVST